MPSPVPALPSLADQYRIDRELGGGGMSRVFLAEEIALGRMVVIKVLPAELAATVSTERFKREIQVVAALQHPHIVPVLAAGSADGLLYYTMPFVDGLSLRERISAHAALPVPEATTIIREVADALAYAHGRGLVHRDIKPENVLLSQGHALVTDFGIAKALSRGEGSGAGSGAAGGDATGSLETPTYMSPEQGVGDPTTDHRSDLYSLGVMAYELLAGVAPFADRSGPHALLMAHMLEAPRPLSTIRPEIPAAVAAVIMQCLAKQPNDRPASADEIVKALGSGVMHAVPLAARSGGAGRLARIRPAAGAAIILAVVAAAYLGLRGTRYGSDGDASDAGVVQARADTLPADRVTVTTFANETGDSSLDGMGRIAADWLTTGLAGTGIIKVLDARAAMRDTGSASGSMGSAVRTARSLGAGLVVTGSYYRVGNTLQFVVKLVDARTSEVLQALDAVKGPASDPSAMIDAVRQQTLGALAVRLNPRLSAMSASMSAPPSYAAYQEIVAGMDAYFAGDMPKARTRFVHASLMDTANVQSRTWLLETLEASDELRAADSVARQLEARRARLSPLESAQLDEYTSSIRKRPAANLAAAFRMHALAPTGQYRTTLAQKLLLANRWQEALDTLSAAPAEIGMLKDKPNTLEQRRRLLHRLGRFDDELVTARELERRFPGPTRLFDEARAYAALGNADTLPWFASTIVRQLGPGVTTSRTVLMALSDELRAHGHAAASMRLLTTLLASYDTMGGDSSRALPAMRGRAEVLARLGRWNDAYALMKPLVAADTGLATRMSLAIGAAHAGDPSAAIALEGTIRRMPVDPYRPGNTDFLLARLAIARGDRALAVRLLADAQARYFPLYDAVHAQLEFDALRGDPAFEALFTP